MSGRLGTPQARQLAGELRQRLALIWGQRLGAVALDLGELAPFRLELVECLLLPRLKRPPDEPVLGLARVELALGPPGLELSALHGKTLAASRSSCCARAARPPARRRAPPPG